MSESIVSYFCRALYLVCQLSCLPISLSLSLSLYTYILLQGADDQKREGGGRNEADPVDMRSL